MILRYHYFADVCASVLIGIFAFYAPYRFGYKFAHTSPEYIELESTDISTNKISTEKNSDYNYIIINESKDKSPNLKLNTYIKGLIYCLKYVVLCPF